jgi:hypothetical protein
MMKKTTIVRNKIVWTRKKSRAQTVKEVHRLICRGYTDVVDAGKPVHAGRATIAIIGMDLTFAALTVSVSSPA